MPTVPGSPPTDPRRAQFITHGAPPTLDDARWLDSLFTWSQRVPEPRAVVVSAHRGSAPLAISRAVAALMVPSSS